MVIKTFKGTLKSKVNHSKRLKVIGQGEILVNQGFLLTMVADQPTATATFVTPPCCVKLLYNYAVAIVYRVTHDFSLYLFN